MKRAGQALMHPRPCPVACPRRSLGLLMAAHPLLPLLRFRRRLGRRTRRRLLPPLRLRPPAGTAQHSAMVRRQGPNTRASTPSTDMSARLAAAAHKGNPDLNGTRTRGTCTYAEWWLSAQHTPWLSPTHAATCFSDVFTSPSTPLRDATPNPRPISLHPHSLPLPSPFHSRY